MKDSTSLSRREFIITASTFAGGLAIGVSPARAALSDPQPSSGSNEANEFTPWLAIFPNGEIVVRVTPPEIGNGVMTQVAMTVNEELGADWSSIRAEPADTNRNFREDNVYAKVGGIFAYFAGRSTLEERMATALQVGASARERLKAAAAKAWGVPAQEVEAEKSILTHKQTGRFLSYGDVAEAASRIKLNAEPAPKPRSEWETLTKVSRSKLQDPMLVNGSAVYGIDVNVPGKVYAALKQVPVQGGRLKSFDKSAVMGMPGVLDVVVVDPDEERKPISVKPPIPISLSAAQAAVAVIAEHYWQAKTALEALPVEWDLGDGVQWTSNDKVKDAALEAVQSEGEITMAQGNAPEAIDSSARVVERDYFSGYADHMTLEPLNGTALVTKNRVDVWLPTQYANVAHVAAAEESGMDVKAVYLHQTLVGGGFGRRTMGDDARMVVAIARKYPDTPVHTIWTREESTRQGRYRSMAGIKFKAGLDDDGYPTGLLIRHAGRGHGERALNDGAYTAGGGIPAIQLERHVLPLNFMVGFYRAPTYNTNTFAMETFIDELAHETGIDPLEYRLKLLEPWADKGWAKLLKTLAGRAEWGKSLPEGQGMGLAIANWRGLGKPHSGTTAAAVAQVEVSKAGELTVHQLDVGADVGTIANPDGFRAQMEGGTIFGLNMALLEELEIKNGAIVSDNFDSYPMLRMRDIPANIFTHLDATSGHERLSDIGEPLVGPVGPAIGNAIFRATGKRIRELPLRKADLSWA